MARILGVDIPNGKKIKVSLTYIYGIGDSRALEICSKAKVDPEKKTADLTETELAAIREVGIKYIIYAHHLECSTKSLNSGKFRLKTKRLAPCRSDGRRYLHDHDLFRIIYSL